MREDLYRRSQERVARLFRFFDKIGHATNDHLFFTIEAEGLENLEGLSGPLIIAANHKSFVDHFFVLALFPRENKLMPLRGVAADWLFRVPWYKLGFFIRWGLNALGAYPAKAGQGLSVSLKHPLEILKDGGTVGIYPEGGIYFRRGIKELKDMKIGAAVLAKESGAPILPIAICGVEYLKLRNFFLGKRHIKVIFGKMFFPDPKKDAAEITKEIHEKLEELYERGMQNE